MTAADPAAWGIEQSYHRTDGQEYEAPPETIEAILRSMRAGDAAAPKNGPLVVRSGVRAHVGDRWTVVTEDGREVYGEHVLPGDLPLGYHQLHVGDRDQLLVVAPGRCLEPPHNGSWGWALQLYAARSKASWGMGDLGDLRTFGLTARAHGADMAMINPLHASLPGVPQESSPYFPSSRSFRNPLYLRIEDIEGADSIGGELTVGANAGRALNEQRNIDRDAVWRLKLDVLEKIWKAAGPSKELNEYIETGGEPLLRYATFCALVEEFGRSWGDWPSDYRHPLGAKVRAFASQRSDRVQFHAWLQYLIDRQLAAAAGSIDLMQDLAIGVDPGGADAWIWQDAMALDMKVGVPPDVFNTGGQDWGLPPFDPWALRAMNYEPFIATLRANMKHGTALRIDHAMGLFRLFWIPRDESPAAGAYVRYASDDMLALVALESHRTGAYVVGEDLGTVEPYMRQAFSDRAVLAYKLLWFEDGAPHDFPKNSMAAVTTHDLPTVAGLWSGRDLDIQHELGLSPNEDATAELRTKVGAWVGDEKLSVSEVTAKVHHRLGTASSAVITASLEDALGCVERPNYPGTIKEYPNWSVALPVALDELDEQPGFVAISETLDKDRKEDVSDADAAS